MISKKESQLFLLGWLQTFKRSFFVFVKYFWWLIALDVFLKNFFSPSMIIRACTSMFIVYFSILSIRASIENKSFLYFLVNLKKIALFAGLYTICFIAFNTTIAFIALVPTLIITTFFSLDSNLDAMNIWYVWDTLANACKGILVYFPFFLPITALYVISYFVVPFLFSPLPNTIALIRIVLNFFFACAIAILYLKIKHANPQLFLEKSH